MFDDSAQNSMCDFINGLDPEITKEMWRTMEKGKIRMESLADVQERVDRRKYQNEMYGVTIEAFRELAKTNDAAIQSLQSLQAERQRAQEYLNELNARIAESKTMPVLLQSPRSGYSYMRDVYMDERIAESEAVSVPLQSSQSPQPLCHPYMQDAEEHLSANFAKLEKTGGA